MLSKYQQVLLLQIALLSFEDNTLKELELLKVVDDMFSIHITDLTKQINYVIKEHEKTTKLHEQEQYTFDVLNKIKDYLNK